MTTSSCPSPLRWSRLLAYWFGELKPDDEARIEGHYLGCTDCSRRLEWLVALTRASRVLTRSSAVSLVIDPAFVTRLQAEGMQVTEYRVPRNGSVDCTVAPDDDFVVARLEAPLAEAEHLDLVQVDEEGHYLSRQADIPFVAETGAVLFSAAIDQLRALPSTRLRLRLVAVNEGGESILGDYVFNHSPHSD